MTIDVKIRCSKLLAEADFWHCPDGIISGNMKMINEEFNNFRGLFPLRVVMGGPPVSGKTYFAEKLAKAYGVPHITAKEIAGMVESASGEFRKEIETRVEEMKDKVVEEYDKNKKKKDPELDRATIKVRLPDDIMFVLFKMRVESSACRNKGFILDGYPKCWADAQALFMIKP